MVISLYRIYVVWGLSPITSRMFIERSNVQRDIMLVVCAISGHEVMHAAVPVSGETVGRNGILSIHSTL